MLEKVKKALRISHVQLDDEIQDLIDASIVDLSISGVVVDATMMDDPLVLQAVKLYCKANSGLGNADSEKYQMSYESLKISLSLCGDYNGAV